MKIFLTLLLTLFIISRMSRAQSNTRPNITTLSPESKMVKHVANAVDHDDRSIVHHVRQTRTGGHREAQSTYHKNSVCGCAVSPMDGEIDEDDVKIIRHEKPVTPAAKNQVMKGMNEGEYIFYCKLRRLHLA